MVQNLEQLIAGWKAEYGKVYKTTIDGEEFIWRKLKRKEYVDIVLSGSEEDKTEDIYLRQELITKTVVLYPENASDLIDKSAGIAFTLSEEILAKSGFGLPTTKEL